MKDVTPPLRFGRAGACPAPSTAGGGPAPSTAGGGAFGLAGGCPAGAGVPPADMTSSARLEARGIGESSSDNILAVFSDNILPVFFEKIVQY